MLLSTAYYLVWRCNPIRTGWAFSPNVPHNTVVVASQRLLGYNTRCNPPSHERCQQFCAAAKPKRAGSAVVDSYQTVSVLCSSCGIRLFRYKKKNGTKSNLVKCYIERILEDCQGVLNVPQQQQQQQPLPQTDHTISSTVVEYVCPSCQSRFARSAVIKGLPALKLVGGKTRMTKK